MRSTPRFLISIVTVIILNIFISPTTIALQEPPDSLIYKDVLPVRTLDITSNDFSDLMPLKEKIGDSRIVLLGEESHGGAYTFLMKGRLIKFLHEEMGFNVLAWESGISCVEYSDKALADESIPALEAGSRGIFGVWMLAEELRPLTQYLRQTKSTNNPIVNVGVDCQFSTTFCTNNFTDDVDRFFNVIKPNFVDREKIAKFRTYCENYYVNTDDAATLAAVLDLTDEFIQMSYDFETQLAEYHSLIQIKYFRQKLLAFKDESNRYLDNDNRLALRDKSMAKQFTFLAKELYPNEKLIVWAHTYHNLRNHFEIENNNWENDSYMMGEGIYEEFGDQTYNIGFIYYEGAVMDNTFKFVDEYEPAHIGSLEWLLRQINKKRYFLDLKNLPAQHWLRTTKLKSRIYGTYYYVAQWPNIFDAIMYMPVSKPKTRAGQQ